MTSYAVDLQRHMLVRIIPSAQGSIVGDVVHYWPEGEGSGDAGHGNEARSECAVSGLQELAEALTTLSEALWASYAGWDEEGAGDRRDAVLGGVSEMLRAPSDGSVGVAAAERGPALRRYLMRGPVDAQEAAYCVWRLLQRLGSSVVTEAVVAEVEEEIGGIHGAEAGDLAGRAAQAAGVTRTHASALQVVAAFDALGEDPLDGRALMEVMDPHSAAVAAAYWLFCAVQVASAMTGTAVERVMEGADEIEELPVEAPARVLELMSAGEDPYEAVADLVRASLEGSAEDAVLLDPARPAPGLVEDLLAAIYGAFLVWDERDASSGAPSRDASEEQWQDFQENRREAFSALVRAEATRRRGQLGLAPV